MKTAVISFKKPAAKIDGTYVSEIADALYIGGFATDETIVLPSDDETAFKRALERFKDTVDNLIVAVNEIEFDIKPAVAEIMNTVFDENENARRFAEAAGKRGEDVENYVSLPIDGTLIPNVYGAFQGYMLEDMEFTLFVLSGEIAAYRSETDKYVLPYLEKKYDLKNRRLVLKYFGKSEELYSALKEAEKLSDGKFSADVKEKNGDFTVALLFTDYDGKNGGDVVRFLIGELKDNLYAEYDVSLSERLFDLLKLKKLKLATAESFTGGRVAASVIKNAGASEVFYEGITAYSNESKIKRLGVNRADLIKEGAVSSIVAYQMVSGLFARSDIDIALSTTGLAGPQGEGDKPVGLCFIAVGMKDGVHTYKFNFKGTREEITETAKNTALFLAIKKIKSI